MRRLQKSGKALARARAVHWAAGTTHATHTRPHNTRIPRSCQGPPCHILWNVKVPLMAVMTVATAVVVTNDAIRSGQLKHAPLDELALGLSSRTIDIWRLGSFTLSLMLSFRIKAAYDRWWEGRAAFANTRAANTTIYMQATTWINDPKLVVSPPAPRSTGCGIQRARARARALPCTCMYSKRWDRGARPSSAPVSQPPAPAPPGRPQADIYRWGLIWPSYLYQTVLFHKKLIPEAEQLLRPDERVIYYRCASPGPVRARPRACARLGAAYAWA